MTVILNSKYLDISAKLTVASESFLDRESRIIPQTLKTENFASEKQLDRNTQMVRLLDYLVET